MMLLRHLLLFVFAICFLNTSAQNVGVNTSTPNHDLDVNGDVNVVGEVLLNGAPGQAGQVIQATGSGGMQWGDPMISSTYKYHRTYKQATSSFVVPPGVTEIRVQLWGAGGAGYTGGGGGSGLYRSFLLDVTPGSVLTTLCGAGSNSAAVGGRTEINYNGGFQFADGGLSATASRPGQGVDYLYTTAIGILIPGTPGKRKSYRYEQIGSSSHATHIDFGSGGVPAYMPIDAPQGFYSLTVNGSGVHTTSIGTARWGCGGGGSSVYQRGGNGVIMISWNED